MLSHAPANGAVQSLAISLLCAVLALTNVASSASPAAREFDIVIFGATGYVGSLLVASLLGDRSAFLSLAHDARLNSGADGVRFALAGRSAAKLDKLRARYASAGFDVSGVGLIIADAEDPASLERLVTQAKVILTTVYLGPTHDGRFGDGTLIRKCLEHGTSYLELDGYSWLGDEALVAEMDGAARASKCVIGPLAGELSVPADMATFVAWKELGRPKLRRSTAFALYFDGLSRQAMDDMAPFKWAEGDEYALRMSAASLGYGESFRFSELSPSNAAHRNAKRRDVRRAARFTVVAEAEAEDERRVAAVMAGGEVDYEDTARFLLEMGLSLVLDEVPAAKTGGVWTAAAGWGEALLERLAAIGLGVVVAKDGADSAVRDALRLQKP